MSLPHFTGDLIYQGLLPFVLLGMSLTWRYPRPRRIRGIEIWFGSHQSFEDDARSLVLEAWMQGFSLAYELIMSLYTSKFGVF